MRRRATRRGSAYLLVLGASLLLVTAGMGAIYASGVRRSSGELRVDAYRARLAAEAGIEAALDTMAVDPNWRTTQPNGVWFNKRPSGDALGSTFTLTGVDPIDANLANSASDPVEFIAEGLSGRGRYKLRVQVNSNLLPLSCLRVAALSGGDQTHSSTTITNDQTIASNGAITATLATIAGRVEAAGLVLGVTYTGSTASLQPARTLPAVGVATSYAAMARSVTYTSINMVAGKRTIRHTVISTASGINGGNTSPVGIYAIDCGGGDICIQDCRIVGTLVLLNAGPGTTIQGSLNWAPATPGYPILIVQGSATIRFDSATPLSEATTGTNFNPVGTPYLGVTDGDTTDIYPSEMRGLVYVTGNLTTAGSPSIIGNLVCRGTVSTGGTLRLSYDPASHNAPPPGFFVTPVPVKFVAGSWQQLVD